VPLLLRIYVVQNEKTPWEVNIDGGYSLMRQVSDFDLVANRSPYSHNLLLGLAVQRMLSGPFFLGMTMRTTALNITNAEMGSRHLWELGLRAGMKLNGKW
jgi:hypothetical protein